MRTFSDRARHRRDHRWAPRRMSAYLDGELAPSPRARIERHTADCPECRALLDGLRRMLGALHRLPPALGGVDPVVVAASVRGRLDAPSPPGSEPSGGLGGSNRT